MQRPISRFISNHSNVTETNLAQDLSSNINRLLQRLEFQSADFPNIRITVKTIQCLHLELIGLIDYCTVYKPRIATHTSGTVPSPSVSTVVGAFVDSTLYAEMLFKAGIPFWFVRPVSSLMRVRVDQLADPLGIDIFEIASSRPPIWEGGSIDTVAIHKAILTASGCFTSAGPVFKTSMEPASPSIGPHRTKRQRNSKYGIYAWPTD